MVKAAEDPFEREVRLGLVLYGGVSLAVYENGVAQEMFRAVKGEGVYTLVKELIRSDIVVDIVSGTSAGGINGVMLGYALANGRDFKNCARLWREDGDLLRLLREPKADASASLLDSKQYYQERLEAAYDGMPAYVAPANDGVDADRRRASSVEEFDLFVTGTDVQGHVYTVFDEQSHPIDVKEHRACFQLSYRSSSTAALGWRKNEFDVGRSASLAKLSRITSCFPVAFEPVHVGESAEDALLRLWGKLNNRKSIFFLDGGVLNNKPFSYTIDAILRRTADRDVSRMLLYVEPDPEQFQNERRLAQAPNVIQSAVDALIGIRGYQSISGDLQAIAEHNDQAQLQSEILASLQETSALDGRIDWPPKSGDTEAAGWKAIEAQASLRMYQAARLNQLRDRAVEGILKTVGQRPLLREHSERHAARLLVECFRDWQPQQDDPFTATPEATLRYFDVNFRMRRLLHVCDFLKNHLYPKDCALDPAPEKRAYRDQVRQLWRRLNHQFKLLEEIQFAMGRAIDLAEIPWKDLKDQDVEADRQEAAGQVEVNSDQDPKKKKDEAQKRWKMVEHLLVCLLDSKELPPLEAALLRAGEVQRKAASRERESLIRALKMLADANKGATPSKEIPIERGYRNVLLRCDKLERQIIRCFAPRKLVSEVEKEYNGFLLLDAYLFPAQRMARMQFPGEILTVRISPIDAQRAYSARTLNAKLCGKSLA